MNNDLLPTLIKAIVAYFAIEAIFSVLVIGLFALIIGKFMK